MTGEHTRTTALAVSLAAIVLCSLVGTGLAAAGAVNPTTEPADRSTIDGPTTNDATDSVGDPSLTAVTQADSSFTAYGQEGTIVLSGDREVVFPESDEDEPLPENAPEDVEWEDDSFVIDADVDLEEGTWAATEEVMVPQITSFRVDADRAEVQMSAPDGFDGTIDPETGEMTATADFRIEAEVIGPLFGLGPDSTCVTETELELTTETSDDLTGSPLEIDAENDTATATVVDDTFTVPSFDTVDGVGPVCSSAGDSFGLPAEEPGDNEFVIEFWFDLENFDGVATDDE